ncbi:unnamed protein product, partial [Ixodes hexagonus]
MRMAGPRGLPARELSERDLDAPHANLESWCGRHGEYTSCGISGWSLNSPQEVPGGHRGFREDPGRVSPRQGAGRWRCPCVSRGPTQIASQANHPHQSPPSIVGGSWHAGGAILQLRSTDPRSIGQSPPDNSRSQARWRHSHSGSLSGHWRRSDGHLGAGDQSRPLSSDHCSDCEQPGHHYKCPRPRTLQTRGDTRRRQMVNRATRETSAAGD